MKFNDIIWSLANKYKKLIRFGLVGVLNTAVDFGVFSIFNFGIQLHYSISQVAGYTAGILNSFILNKLWTFENKEVSKKTVGQFLQFVVVNLVSLSISLIGINLLVERLGMQVLLAKLCVTVLAQVVNFSGYRLWVFKTSTS